MHHVGYKVQELRLQERIWGNERQSKKYLIDTYIVDWAPKPEPKPVGPTSRPAIAPKQSLKLNRGFLDDTDDEDDAGEGNVYRIFSATYPISCLYFFF